MMFVARIGCALLLCAAPAFGQTPGDENPDLAAEAYAAAIAHDPSDVAAHLGRIEALLALHPYQRDELPDAVERAVEATADSPADQARALALWGDLHWRNGMFDLAEADWRRALAVEPSQRLAQIGLASVALMDGAPTTALERIRALGETSPEEYAALVRFLRDAHALFVASGAVFADRTDNHLAYAMLLVTAYPDAPQEALLPLERATLLAPENHAAWNLMGGLRRQLGDDSGARSAYRRSLTANPDQPYTQRLLEELEGAR